MAKRRLSPLLDASARARLGKAVAAHTIEVVRSTGAEPVVVTSDHDVAGWAKRLDVPALIEERPGLDPAAARAVGYAEMQRAAWLVLHADLPLVAADDVAEVIEALDRSRFVLAPSTDGGTNAFGGRGAAPEFAYGPGSLHRHLARLARFQTRMVVRLGLALDLDDPSDLLAARHHPRGRWMAQFLPD